MKKNINEEKDYKIRKIDIVDEMESSFLDYAMSVIVSRALPDVRDGLKPVHRRILFAMNELEMTHTRPYKKSARIVGEVIGKYHPHGDSAVYESLVRMAQDFSLRYPLVEGQGNFGSIDGDSAAAMRYTEARMSAISGELLKDIKKETVTFIDNYDGSEREPTILPSQFPSLLANGSTGIAVGMATNIPPHNLNEIIDALIVVAKNNEVDDFELINIVKGPDFPTGATILGDSGIKEAYLNGSGSLIIQSKTEIIENEKHGPTLIIREIPYMVNKSKLIEKIAELIKEKRIESIKDLRDETNREGIRIVIEFKRGTNAQVELNKLYKSSQLQTTFSINLLAITNGQPKIMKLKEILLKYNEFLEEILINKTKFKLRKAKERSHILEGLQKAIDNIDEIIALIKKSKKTSDASKQLEAKFKLSAKQAKAVLEMRLQRLTGLEKEKIADELNLLLMKIKKYEILIKSKDERIKKIVKNLLLIKEKFGDERKTAIIEGEIKSIDDESLIPKKNIVITISESGYIKRVPLELYESQNRGGIGKIGMKTNAEDNIRSLIVTSTHSDVMFFTNVGKVYKVRAHKIPMFGRHSKGIPIINLIDIDKKEEVKTMLPIVLYDANHFLIFATRNGIIKKTSLSNFVRINKNGKIALGLKDKDEVLDVKKSEKGDYILIGSKHGKVITFQSDKIRAVGRTASGVKGMNVPTGSIIDLAVAKSREAKILSISEKGYGKLTTLEEYRITSRGGKGVISLNVKKAGLMASIIIVENSDDLLITTNKGTLIRINVGQISSTSRNAKGVTIKKVKPDETIKSVAVIKETIKDLGKDIEEESAANKISDETKTVQEQLNIIKDLNVDTDNSDDDVE